MKANVTLRSAHNLPKIGLATMPSPYAIIHLNKHSIVSGICENTSSPRWNFNCSPSSHSKLEDVLIYIYNSNPNDVDELLAYGSIEFEELLTQVPTTTKIMLKDGYENPLRSYVQIEHYDEGAQDSVPIEFSDKTCIKLIFLNITGKHEYTKEWLGKMKDPYLMVEYGKQSRELSKSNNDTTLQYISGNQEINVHLLQGKHKISGHIKLDNVGRNGNIKCKLYHQHHEIHALMCVSVIPNGKLPADFNTLQMEITEIEFVPKTRKPKSWSLVVHGIFESQVIKDLHLHTKLYVENKSELLLEFVEDVEDYSPLDLEPLNSYSLPINGINWSENYESSLEVSLYNSTKGLSISLTIKFSLFKNNPAMSIVPQLSSPYFQKAKNGSTVKMNMIKMTGACFNEIFTEKTVFKFAHISHKGLITMLPSFELKASTEYNINTRSTLFDGGKGALHMVTFDHQFGEAKSKELSLENHSVFKVIFDDVSQINESKILFNEKFLSYAKKVSLSKLCKRFDQMIKDRTLNIAVMSKSTVPFREGHLKIHNCLIEGASAISKYKLVFDSNEFELAGEAGAYILKKPYSFRIKENTFELSSSSNSLFSSFYEVFGLPEEKKYYRASIPVLNEEKLQIIYSFQPTQGQFEEAKSKLDSQIKVFNEGIPLNFRLKSATIQHENCNGFRVRLTKGTTVYESLTYNCQGNYLSFRNSEKIVFDDSFGQNDRYIFANLYCHSSEGDLVIYSGHLDCRTIMGRGCYELVLWQMHQESKKCAHLVIELMSGLPLDYPEVKLHLKTIKCTHLQFLKNLMKYYLVAEVHHEVVGMFEVKKESDLMAIGESIMLKERDSVAFKIYSSLKPLSREMFWKSEKELIASGWLFWNQLQPEAAIELKYLPSRDLRSKFNQNKLTLQESSVKFLLHYAVEGIKESTQVLVLKKKPKTIDIDVLHSAGMMLAIKDIVPHFSEAKTLEFSLEPLNYKFCCHSKMAANECFLLPLTNMKLKLALTKHYRKGGKYLKEVQEQLVELKGRHIKTHDKYAFNVNFPGLCQIQAWAVIFSNRFTNSPNGTLSLNTLTIKGQEVREVEVHLLDSPSKVHDLQAEPFRINMNGKDKASLQHKMETASVSSCLHFVIVLANKSKIKSMVELAKLEIGKMDLNPFTHEWLVEGQKLLHLCLQANYVPHDQEKLKSEKVKYTVFGDEKKQENELEYNKKEYLEILHENNNSENIPADRVRGYKMVAKLPEVGVSRLWLVLEDGSELQLRKTLHRDRIFTLTSDKQLKVKELKLQPGGHLVEELEPTTFMRRFLIDRNPKLIINLSEEPYAVAKNNKQSMVVSFCLHRLLGVEPNKKIMWLSNNKYDEILTHEFGLMVKHGNQRKVIRPINERGQLVDFRHHTVSFGYQSEIDELELYLYIHHILNEDEEAEEFTHHQRNWMKMLPVAHGKISLEALRNDRFVGCEMESMANENETVDHALNQVIMKEELQCLGAVTMEKRGWGFISLSLESMSPVELEGEIHNALVYLSFSVETAYKQELAGNVTEARPITSDALRFTTKKVKFLHLEKKEEMYSLKVAATVIGANNKFDLFEKRIDLTQALQHPGEHPLVSQIKEVNGCTKSIQLEFQLTNSHEPERVESVLEHAESINKIDIVSFKANTVESMREKMHMCQHGSHLKEIMEEVKESIIYSKEEQLPLVETAVHYLCFQNDSFVIRLALEILHIAILKHPKLLAKLSKDKPLMDELYQHILVLSEGNELKPDPNYRKVTRMEYEDSLKEKKTELERIKMQKTVIYESMQVLEAASPVHLEEILEHLHIYNEESEQFAAQFNSDIEKWTAIFCTKEDKIFIGFLTLVDKTYLRKSANASVLTSLLSQVLDRVAGIGFGVEFWNKLDPQNRSLFTTKLFACLVDNLHKSAQFVQSFRLFLNYLSMHKVKVQSELWAKAVIRCMESMASTGDTVVANTYGELLNKIDGLGHFAEGDKVKYVQLLKKKQGQAGEKNKKLVYSNLLDRIQKKNQASKGQGNSTGNKNHFYKKYLITS